MWFEKSHFFQGRKLLLTYWFLLLFSGRVSVKSLSKKSKRDLSREERRNKSKQIRTLKREEATSRKRALGTASSPPFLVTVVPLSPNINPRKVLNALISCEEAATVNTSPQGIVHLRYCIDFFLFCYGIFF